MTIDRGRSECLAIHDRISGLCTAQRRLRQGLFCETFALYTTCVSAISYNHNSLYLSLFISRSASLGRCGYILHTQ
jgi:hypothetical protein